MILTVERIREMLSDRHLKIVSDKSGVKYHTVRAIASGEVTNPSYESVRRLSEYLNEQGA